jgi:hypothetical protein
MFISLRKIYKNAKLWRLVFDSVSINVYLEINFMTLFCGDYRLNHFEIRLSSIWYHYTKNLKHWLSHQIYFKIELDGKTDIEYCPPTIAESSLHGDTKN